MTCDKAARGFLNVDLRGNARSVSRSFALLREESSYNKLCGVLNGILEVTDAVVKGNFIYPAGY
jgi:hypothetical protein